MTRGYFIPIGSGMNRRTLVHEEDAVRAALLAAHSPRSQAAFTTLATAKYIASGHPLAISSALGARNHAVSADRADSSLAAAADKLSFLVRHPCI